MDMPNQDTSDREKFYEAEELYNRGNLTEAYTIYMYLAHQGYASCQAFVGYMLYGGHGVERNLDEAYKWLDLAARNKDPLGMFYLGKMHENRGDMTQAISIYEQAAIEGDLPALFRLGKIYQKGIGIAVNSKRALEYYRKAAESGHVFSKRELGVAMIKGELGFFARFKGLWLFLSAITDVLLLKDPHDRRFGF